MREKESVVTRTVLRHADGAVAPQAAPAGDASVSARDERVDAVRRRVREGAYDARAVVEQVARRILERGDL